MDSLLTSLLIGAIAGLSGIAIGWRFGLRRFQHYLADMENESGARSLELLETRQHLRKISGHLQTSLKKDKTIRQLKRKQKSLLREIDQHVLKARRQEKAHFIQTAKIKLELIEARMHKGKVAGYDQNGFPVQMTSGSDERQLAGANGGATVDAILDNNLTPSSPDPAAEKDFGQLNSDLQLLLEQAGIRRIRQLANLSKQEIDQLTAKSDRQTAD